MFGEYKNYKKNDIDKYIIHFLLLIVREAIRRGPTDNPSSITILKGELFRDVSVSMFEFMLAFAKQLLTVSIFLPNFSVSKNVWNKWKLSKTFEAVM